MSPELLAVAAGPAAGAMVGAFSGSLFAAWWRSRRLVSSADEEQPRPPDERLSEADREALASAFATHPCAVAGQVSAFADELAGGDVILRERLRLLERDGHRTW